MQKPWKSIVLVAVGVIAGATIATGVTASVEAGAGGTSTTAPTWYGCVSKAGALSKVGTVAPSCPSKAKAISWNSYPSNANGMPQCTGIPRIGIDLSGCYLAGANMSGLDLTSANLSNADLRGTDLQDDDFNGTNFDGATFMSASNLANVTWDDTTCPDGTNSNNDGGSCLNNLG